MGSYKGPESKNKKSRTAVLVILGLLLIAILLFLLRSCTGTDAPSTDDPVVSPSGGLIYDPGTVVGGWEDPDTDQIIADLNEKIEEGMIRISMNASPVFADGSSAGNLMIVNETVNRYPQMVEIICNDTGELLYRSGGIPVGSKIETAKLIVDLPAGQYHCTAMVHNVDPDTGNSLGCAGAVITITVLG